MCVWGGGDGVCVCVDGGAGGQWPLHFSDWGAWPLHFFDPPVLK